jgi:hypothetical protein
MIAVLFDDVGAIRQAMRGSAENIHAHAEAQQLHVLEVEQGAFQPDELDALDVTHRVVAGELVPIA